VLCTNIGHVGNTPYDLSKGRIALDELRREIELLCHIEHGLVLDVNDAFDLLHAFMSSVSEKRVHKVTADSAPVHIGSHENAELAVRKIGVLNQT
jgi:hypothetical protein